jgi:hypothetical protein
MQHLETVNIKVIIEKCVKLLLCNIRIYIYIYSIYIYIYIYDTYIHTYAHKHIYPQVLPRSEKAQLGLGLV